MDPGVKGPAIVEGGVSRRWSPKEVSAEQGVMFPDVRAWTPAAKTASSLESLRLISDGYAKNKIYYIYVYKIKCILIPNAIKTLDDH